MTAPPCVRIAGESAMFIANLLAQWNCIHIISTPIVLLSIIYPCESGGLNAINIHYNDVP